MTFHPMERPVCRSMVGAINATAANITNIGRTQVMAIQWTVVFIIAHKMQIVGVVGDIAHLTYIHFLFDTKRRKTRFTKQHGIHIVIKRIKSTE